MRTEPGQCLKAVDSFPTGLNNPRNRQSGVCGFRVFCWNVKALEVSNASNLADLEEQVVFSVVVYF